MWISKHSTRQPGVSGGAAIWISKWLIPCEETLDAGPQPAAQTKPPSDMTKVVPGWDAASAGQ